jgi:hypothetical protein
MEDVERSGRPTTSRNEQTIEKVRDSPWICSWRPNNEWAALFMCNGTVTVANSSRPSRISQFKGMVSPAWQCACAHRRCCWAFSRKKTSDSASPSLVLVRFGSSGLLSISQTEITIEREAFSGHFHNTRKCDKANQKHSEILV